jgi:repressor LexA
MHPVQDKLLKVIENQDISSLTLREIGALINEKLPQTVKHHLSQLERKGFIKIDLIGKRISRTVDTTNSEDILASIPIVGSANCGPFGIYADHNVEGFLKISKRLIKNKTGLFAIQARGNSLNKANIQGKSVESGDFLIVDSENTVPADGDYIVTILDGMANVKKFKFDRKYSRIALISESTQEYTPIFIHEEDGIVINGKVIDVVKKYIME